MARPIWLLLLGIRPPWFYWWPRTPPAHPHRRRAAVVSSDHRQRGPGNSGVISRITTGRANKARLNRSPVPQVSVRSSGFAHRARCCISPEDLALVRGDPAERRRYPRARWPPWRRPAGSAGVARAGTTMSRWCSGAPRCCGKSAGPARHRGDTSMLDTLESWDVHLASHGAQLISARVDLVNQLAPEVEKAYQLLAPASRPPPSDTGARWRFSWKLRPARAPSTRRCTSTALLGGVEPPAVQN